MQIEHDQIELEINNQVNPQHSFVDESFKASQYSKQDATQFDQSIKNGQFQAFGLTNSIPGNPSIHQELIDLSLGEPHLSEFPSDALTEIAQIPDIQRYYPSLGSEKLRALIQRKFYHNLNAENIVITHGAIGALDIIMRAFVSPHAEILIPDPGFPPYEKLAKISGYQIQKYQIQQPAKNEINSAQVKTMINWQELDSLVNKNTKIVLFNTPHNPTGMIFTEFDFQLFKQFLRRHSHVYFIMDEVYRELIFDGLNYFDYSDFIHRGFIVGSFSKMFPLQGARIGWVVSVDYQLKKLYPYFFNAYGAISSFGQELAFNLMQRNLQYLDRYRLARDYCVQKLTEEQISFVKPKSSFFMMIEVSDCELELVQELSQLGVRVTAGSQFGANGSGYIRICFAHEFNKLEKALDLICLVWRKFHNNRLNHKSPINHRILDASL